MLVAITMTIGMLMICRSASPLAARDIARFGWEVWGPFAFAVVFPIVLTWPVWNTRSNRAARRLSVFVPIVAGFASIPILGTHSNRTQIVGAVIHRRHGIKARQFSDAV